MNPRKIQLPLAVLFLFLLTCVASAQSQTSAPSPSRLVVVNLTDGDPIRGNLISTDANNIYVEVNGITKSVALDKVTMIIFAPAQPRTGYCQVNTSILQLKLLNA
jgi:hypothetical protein